MSLADQARDLASQGADWREEIYSVDQSGNPQRFVPAGDNESGSGSGSGSGSDEEGIRCYFTPIRDRQQLEDAHMSEPHDGIMRIKKSTGFQPRLGQIVRLINARNGGGDITVKFDEFGHSAINPEFVIGCGNVF